MIRSLTGSIIFIAAYIGLSFVLFGWTFLTHGVQYAFTFLLFFVVTELIRYRSTRKTGD